MNNKPIRAEDLLRLIRLQALCKTMNAIEHLANANQDKVVYAKQTYLTGVYMQNRQPQPAHSTDSRCSQDASAWPLCWEFVNALPAN
ncbi:MAG: hypothetical protein B7X50_14085 [Alishewanella sp. 34-51-39]|nr:MAG: hypothetical protein B7X50_14085 [Alishewanella sp. 34-51-39]